MTTLTKYQPALMYVPSFDVTENPILQKLYVTVKKISKNQYIRTCMGTTPEEILYSIILFKNVAGNMGQQSTDDGALAGFLTLLGPSPRAVYSDLVIDTNTIAGVDEGTDPYGGDFAKAMTAFVARIVEDPQAKDSTLAAFGDGKSFVKPADSTVKDHHERIMVLCNYVDLLPGIRTLKLNRDEKRNIFFNTFPSSWKESFKRSAHDVTASTVQTIKEWMSMQKRDVDKDWNKKKKDKERLTNGNAKDKRKSAKKSGQASGTTCSIHGGHKWKQCKLNPRSTNFDQAALDRHRANRGSQGRGGRGGRGFQGRGFQGRGFSGRGFQARGPPRENYQNYQHQDQHQMNGPPTTINMDQQSYAASSYPTQAPPSGHWHGNQYYHH